MNVIPSPLDRLLQLEERVEWLQSLQVQPPLSKDHEYLPLPSRHIWPVDELLLTRLLRRSPQVIGAYQAPAELTRTEKSGLLLTTSETASVFQFCELIDGDAVAWVSADPPSWVWASETFKSLFKIPRDHESNDNLVLQILPLFKPVERGLRWSLFRAGEMVPSQRPLPAHEEQVMLLRRIEILERQLSQQQIQQTAEIGELRTELRIHQDMLARLLRVSG